MIKEFIIRKLTEWLELDNIKLEIKNNHTIITNGTSALQENLYRVSDTTNSNQSQIHNINELFSVATDVECRDHRSWAVICIEGKPNYVKFIDLGRSEVREVQSFLRQFEGSRRIVDAPFDMDFMFSDYELGRIK